MRKLKLEVETLAVESFEAFAAPVEAKGTVRANEVPNTQQFRCTYFCSYACPTGLEC
ncbi:MAG TPA: hypothetical protein VFQ39_07725 [Longimicrobium sp.]|nr:hypothetical protein [Longimicrobium sp.]